MAATEKQKTWAITSASGKKVYLYVYGDEVCFNYKKRLPNGMKIVLLGE